VNGAGKLTTRDETHAVTRPNPGASCDTGIVRALALAMMVGGCGFQPGSVAGDGDADGGTGTDAGAPAHDTSFDSNRVASDTAMPSCAVSDPDLRLCLEFDDPNLATATIAVDGSGLHHDATVSNIGVVTRTVPTTSQAITSDDTTAIRIAKSSDFDLQTFTLSAWVNRTALAEYGLFDTGKQYTISINNGNGQVECAVSNNGNTTSQIAAQTAQDEWDLVACTYDGTQLCAISFRNGSTSSQSACVGYNMTLDTGEPSGSAVAAWAASSTTLQSHLIGAIDQVRVWARALSTQEICTAGGLAGC